ncbi:MAG: response regulator [Pseudomonadota bacterium]
MNHEDRLESASRLKLLFVDADRRVLNSLRAMFRHDHDVVAATHVHEALQALDETPVDVVVADDRLPDTNGLDLLHWVRLRAPEAARILLVGAGEQPYDAATIRRAQLFRVLSKPCAPDVLRATIAQAGRTARVGRASALVRAAASAAQPDSAANDILREDKDGTRPVLTLSDDDSGLHRTLDGAEHTFGGTPRSIDSASVTGSVPLADVDAIPANTEASPAAMTDASTPSSEGGLSAPFATPDTASSTIDDTDVAPAPGESTDEHSRPISTRVWSAHGITVEEDAYDDPTDTQRVFASMLHDKSTRPPHATEENTSPAVQVSASLAADSGGHSVLPDAPLAGPIGGVGEALPGAAMPPQPPAAPRASTTAPVVPTEVLLLSDDAITRAELRRALERVHVVVDAASPDAALNAICSSCCAVALVDGRGRSARAVERTARTLLGAAPELSILVFAEVSECAALFELPARVPGIISLLYALPTPQQLFGALSWAHAVATYETELLDAALAVPPVVVDPPVAQARGLPSAAASTQSTGALLSDRLRRVSRFLTGAHDD